MLAIEQPTKAFDQLYDRYCDWISDLTEIRQRMNALRGETRTGWKPSEDIARVLTVLNREDEWYAARNMGSARSILSAAESDANASRAHRLARIDRCKERIATLERAYNGGWRPLEGKQWPHHDVVAWCSMFGSLRFEHLDDLETIIASFEAIRPRLDFGGDILPARRRRSRKIRRQFPRA